MPVRSILSVVLSPINEKLLLSSQHRPYTHRTLFEDSHATLGEDTHVHVGQYLEQLVPAPKPHDVCYSSLRQTA